MIGKFFLILYILSVLFCAVSIINMNCIIHRRTKGWKVKNKISLIERISNNIRTVLMMTLITIIPIVNIIFGFMFVKDKVLDDTITQVLDKYEVEREM